MTKRVAGAVLIRTLACALLLTPTPAGADESAADWQKVSDQDGIIVYQRNADDSATISLRGEAVIDARAEDIFDVMRDNAAARDWIPLVLEKRDLETVSDSERVEYTHIGMPWPLTDRYFINTGKIERLDAGVLRIYVKSVDRPQYAETDKVLGLLNYSEFLLTPRDGGLRTHMSLEVNSDPRGLIPKWLVNLAQRSWPRDFFRGLTDQLVKRGRLTGPTIGH